MLISVFPGSSPKSFWYGTKATTTPLMLVMLCVISARADSMPHIWQARLPETAPREKGAGPGSKPEQRICPDLLS
jgi:hypothetical protein